MYSGRRIYLNNIMYEKHTYIPTYVHTTYHKTAVSGKDKAPADPAAQGLSGSGAPPPKVHNIKICSAFSETQYRSSDRRQHSDRSGVTSLAITDRHRLSSCRRWRRPTVCATACCLYYSDDTIRPASTIVTTQSDLPRL